MQLFNPAVSLQEVWPESPYVLELCALCAGLLMVGREEAWMPQLGTGRETMAFLNENELEKKAAC